MPPSLHGTLQPSVAFGPRVQGIIAHVPAFYKHCFRFSGSFRDLSRGLKTRVLSAVFQAVNIVIYSLQVLLLTRCGLASPTLVWHFRTMDNSMRLPAHAPVSAAPGLTGAETSAPGAGRCEQSDLRGVVVPVGAGCGIGRNLCPDTPYTHKGGSDGERVGIAETLLLGWPATCVPRAFGSDRRTWRISSALRRSQPIRTGRAGNNVCA